MSYRQLAMQDEREQTTPTEDHHTPLPWRTKDNIYIDGKSVGGADMKEKWHPVAMVRGWGHLLYRGDEEAVKIQKANCRRIVAAVNATQGIPTEALEDDVVTVMIEELERTLRYIETGTIDSPEMQEALAHVIKRVLAQARPERVEESHG